MRKKEQRLWDRFHNALRVNRVAAERIENVAAVGTPDVHGAPDWWCELKAVDAAPARAGTPLLGDRAGLNRDQVNWHIWWAAAGGRSYVLIGVGSHENYLLPGRLAERINAMPYAMIKAAACARCVAGSGGWIPILKELTNEDKANGPSS